MIFHEQVRMQRVRSHLAPKAAAASCADETRRQVRPSGGASSRQARTQHGQGETLVLRLRTRRLANSANACGLVCHANGRQGGRHMLAALARRAERVNSCAPSHDKSWRSDTKSGPARTPGTVAHATHEFRWRVSPAGHHCAQAQATRRQRQSSYDAAWRCQTARCE